MCGRGRVHGHEVEESNHPEDCVNYLSAITGFRSIVIRFALVSVVKFASSILIIVLAVHSQCGATCLADVLHSPQPITQSDPPCHQHQQEPSKPSDKPQNTSSPCSQSPIIDAKSSITGKVILDVVAAPVPAAAVTKIDQLSAFALTTSVSPGVWSSPPTLLVLRI